MNLHLQLTWSTHLAHITALHKQRLQFCFFGKYFTFPLRAEWLDVISAKFKLKIIKFQVLLS